MADCRRYRGFDGGGRSFGRGVYESKLGAAAAAAAAAAATSAFAVAYATTPPSDRGVSKQLHRQLQLRDHRALELVALLGGIVGGAHAVDEVARAAPAQSTEPNVLSRRAPPLPRCLTCPSVSIKTCHAYGVMMCQIAPPHNQKKTHCEHSEHCSPTTLRTVVSTVCRWTATTPIATLQIG